MNNTEDKLVSAMSGIVSIQQFLVGLPERETIGERITKSHDFEKFQKQQNDLARFTLSAREVKTAITTTGTANDPLVPSGTPSIDPGLRRKLSIRDLLPAYNTENGAIELPVASSQYQNQQRNRAGGRIPRATGECGQA